MSVGESEEYGVGSKGRHGWVTEITVDILLLLENHFFFFASMKKTV